MKTSRAAAAATLAGLALTLAMAWPVVTAPSSTIFGTETDGPHHDPFTVMRQFEQGPPPFPYRQPLVDDVGRAVARAIGPVDAFNAIVLLTFPLSVLTAFLLARYLGLSHAGASIAAFAFAFAPPHLAHAAYHPHIAQTQWLPLYFLALFAALDRVSAVRLLLLLAAGVALALSNWYSALIAAVLTPVAAAIAAFTSREAPHAGSRARHAVVTMAVLVAVAGVALMLIRVAVPALGSPDTPFAFARADLARYGAQWFSYLVPPVDHPIWGARAAGFWAGRGMTGAVVEQQISFSVALLALAAIAIACWWRSRRASPRARPATLAAVPMLAVVAVAAVVCSLAPAPGSPPGPRLAPASWLHEIAPMFRAYARFAFAAHLMVALLAGIGAACLWGARGARATRPRRAAVVLLLAIAAIEYAPLPPRARDVLPTAAHRWLAGREPRVHVLDCVPLSPAGAFLPWLMQHRVATLSPAIPSCAAPDLAQRAAALGITHVIVRRAGGADRAPAPRGLAAVRMFDDADLYNIVGVDPEIGVTAMEGFSRLETGRSGAWRWMSQAGHWTIDNASGRPVRAALELELSAYAMPRRLSVAFDGGEPQVLDVPEAGATLRLAPWTITPGAHRVTFTALEPAGRAPGRDPRALTVMFRAWTWSRLAPAPLQ